MLTADRITLAPAALRASAEAPETVLIGHASGRVEWRRLLDQPGTLRRIESLGFGTQVRRLRDMAASGGPTNAIDRSLARLERLPVPIDGPGGFNALFPEALEARVAYRTGLGGNCAWLPRAVQDFFSAAQGPRAAIPITGQNGGVVNRNAATEGLTLWVVCVPEESGADAMLPDPSADHFAAERWTALGAFEIALLPPAVGLIGFPDLERLSIPPELDLPPPPDAANPDPAFLPCTSMHMPANLVTAPLEAGRPEQADIPQALPVILDALARLRPDMHALLAVPFSDVTPPGALPGADPATLERLSVLANGGPDAIGATGGGAHRIQMTFPYLTTANDTLRSACGVIAARMASTTARAGAWRSVAGQPLLAGTRAWPQLELSAAAQLRETGRIGVLLTQDGQAVLEDERVAAAALARRSGPGSGEVSRFLGWLRRQLRDFGNRLVFDADPRDPRSGILLDGFLRRLYAAGALDGRTPDEAFTLRQRAGGPGQLIFEIDLLLAPPIDRIHVTLSSDRLDLVAGGSNGR